MTETQKRIEAYQKVLPDIKEKVAAVAMLLALSVIMLTSASFAWLTISRAPEVTSVATNVAANGNLEIALVNPDGSQPEESKVGDSFAVEGNSIVAANLTWGNLVNLNDPSYGLDHLVLKPAKLNTSNLLESPLSAAIYTSDGRVEEVSGDFKYTSWQLVEGSTIDYYFGLAKGFGVRGISSVEMEAVGGSDKLLKVLSYRGEITALNSAAQEKYNLLCSNDAYMTSLSNMMGHYMTARLNSSDAKLGNPTIAIEDLENLKNMYGEFLECFRLEATAMAELLNFQDDPLKSKEDIYTADYVLGNTSGKLPNGLLLGGNDSTKYSGSGKLNNLGQFAKDYKTIFGDYQKLVELCNNASDDVRWKDSGINGIVNNLVTVGTCTVHNKENTTPTPIDKIGLDNALGYAGDNKGNEARITNGILYRFEERVGAYIDANIGITVTVKIFGETKQSVNAHIRTSASEDYTIFGDDVKIAYDNIIKNNEFGEVVYNAKDTYGLAIDLWVRTNAKGSFLTLEGNVMTESEMVDATGKDIHGNTVVIYTLTRKKTVEFTEDDGTTSEETIEVTYDLYKTEKTENGAMVEEWFELSSGAPFTLEEGETPNKKQIEKITVIGYEGENRVWQDNSLLTADATTQGNGSCYVYYADNPEDQARSLELLSAFKVAFVSGNGKRLATGIMDTEHFYAEGGRVTVPLVLDSESKNIGVDENNEPIYVITELEQNTATKITAIVYLDGTRLTNEDVLSAADIQGKLNIQFGTSQNLAPISDERLEVETRIVTAKVSKNGNENPKFSFDETDTTVDVVVNVDGTQPKEVTAFFIRQINSTQGSREKVMTEFVDQGDGNWTTTYKFTTPGNYVLRSVSLDGQEYDIRQETLPNVTVEGFTVNSLIYKSTNSGEITGNSNNHFRVLTAQNSASVDMEIEFASSEKMPESVQGRFLNDENGSAVNVNFQYNTITKKWSGEAVFLASGDYTMQYIVLDGEHTELPEALRKTADITLGMKVAVYTTSPKTFKYDPAKMTDNQKILGMQVKIYDNSGEEIIGLQDVKLVYRMKGSGSTVMDTNLIWDGNYYTGNLATIRENDYPPEGQKVGGVGIWQFGRVEVGSNMITYATTSPLFTIQSLEPPSYVGIVEDQEYQFAPDGGAAIITEINYSRTAKVLGVLTNDKELGREYEVLGTVENISDVLSLWTFKIPETGNYNVSETDKTQDGNWTLKEIRIWNYYDKDGNFVGDIMDEDGNVVEGGECSNPMIVDIAKEEGAPFVTKVVETVFVEIADGQNKDFDAGTFLNPYIFSSDATDKFSVVIKDFENKPVEGLSTADTKLEFTYVANTSDDYGFYTMTDEGVSGDPISGTDEANVAVTLGAAKGTTYSQSTNATFTYAGEYKSKFSFKIGSRDFDWDSSNVKESGTLPTVFVRSEKPTVKVTSVDPAKGKNIQLYAQNVPVAGGPVLNSDQLTGSNYFDDYYAIVYLYNGNNSNKYEVKAPKVKLELSGMPANGFTANMTFPTQAGTGSPAVYTFNSNGQQVEKDIGAFESGFSLFGQDKNPRLYPIGIQTVSQITVTYGEHTILVDLSNPVTIDQQAHQPYAKFNSTASGQTLPTTPGYIVGVRQADRTYTITLPASQTWNVEHSSTANGEFVQKGDPTTRDVYTQRTEGSGCDAKEYYTPYIETTTISEASSSTTRWTVTWTITGWKIGNKTYAPGETITIEGDVTVTAVLSSTKSEEVTEDSITRKTVKTYTKNGNESTTKPSGSKVTSVETSTTEEVI